MLLSSQLLFLALGVFCVGLSSASVPSSIADSCPFADEVHSLPGTVAGIWRDNRIRLVSLALASLGSSPLIVLTGDLDDDRNPFRQNSNFYYVSGANMPSYYISLNFSSANPTPFATLFVPAPSADYAVWNGRVYTKQQLQVMYDVDEVLYTNETTSYVNRFPTTSTVYTITSAVALPSAFTSRFTTINRTTLQSFMTLARATKSSKEIYLMTLVNKISSNAHINAMQFITSRMNLSRLAKQPHPQQLMGMGANAFMRGRAHVRMGRSDPFGSHLPFDDVALAALAELNHTAIWTPLTREYAQPTTTSPLYEYEVQSLFQFQCGLCGALEQSYLPIVGSGNNGAILHYIANNEELTDGELLLIDAGGEYWGYGSDITRTYPVNGVFTAAQTVIYNIVLQTQADVAAAAKPGVTWNTLNTVARDSLTRYMLNAGLIQGQLQDLLNNAVYNIFYPHGIGHSVGLDVHDSQTTTLAANQVITIEPGVYFNSYLLDQALIGTRSRFIVWDLVNTYRGTGGVRIEDDYLVTASGVTPITTVPSSIDAIEKIMQPISM